MANDFGARIWKIDSTMATPYQGLVKIQDWMWGKQTAAGHRLLVVDANGHVLIDVTVDSANENFKGYKIDWANGFQVTQIDSGLLTLSV